MEEGKRQGYLASSRQYGNALLGVRHQEVELRRVGGVNAAVVTQFTISCAVEQITVGLVRLVTSDDI